MDFNMESERNGMLASPASPERVSRPAAVTTDTVMEHEQPATSSQPLANAYDDLRHHAASIESRPLSPMTKAAIMEEEIRRDRLAQMKLPVPVPLSSLGPQLRTPSPYFPRHLVYPEARPTSLDVSSQPADSWTSYAGVPRMPSYAAPPSVPAFSASRGPLPYPYDGITPTKISRVRSSSTGELLESPLEDFLSRQCAITLYNTVEELYDVSTTIRCIHQASEMLHDVGTKTKLETVDQTMAFGKAMMVAVDYMNRAVAIVKDSSSMRQWSKTGDTTRNPGPRAAWPPRSAPARTHREAASSSLSSGSPLGPRDSSKVTKSRSKKAAVRKDVKALLQEDSELQDMLHELISERLFNAEQKIHSPKKTVEDVEEESEGEGQRTRF